MPNAAPRRPIGGYFADSTTRRAWSAHSPLGTIMPGAPMSSARAIKSYSVVGTRTSGTRLVPPQVASSMRIVSIDQPECSISKTANSAAASAARRAMPVVANSNMNAPSAVPPAASLAFTAFGRMLFASSGGQPLQLCLHPRPVQHVAVDDVPRDAPRSIIENRLARRAAIAQKALVGPAQGVRREDHVVQRQQRIARVDRLRIEHIETRTGDPPLLEGRRQGRLIDNR